MNVKQFYKSLAKVEEPGTLEMGFLPFGPQAFGLTVNQADGIAARLLLWLLDEMPEETTLREVMAALDKAKWWVTFWASQPSQPTMEED